MNSTYDNLSKIAYSVLVGYRLMGNVQTVLDLQQICLLHKTVRIDTFVFKAKGLPNLKVVVLCSCTLTAIGIKQFLIFSRLTEIKNSHKLQKIMEFST